MADKNKENEAREVIVKLKYIESQIATLQGQLGMLDRGLMEIATTKTSLASIKELTKETGSLLPLGSGMFAKGTLSKQDKILTDVGAGAIIEKDITEADKILDGREKDIKANILNIQQVLANMENEYNVLTDKARSLIG